MGDQLALFAAAPAALSLPALTFWRPWAESLVSGVKRREFRKHPPPSTIVGKPLCVVAGQRFDKDALEWLREHCGVDWRGRDPATFPVGIVGVVTITGWREDHANPEFGTCAWDLIDAAMIEPVQCAGAHGQGVRYVTGADAQTVLARVAVARTGQTPAAVDATAVDDVTMPARRAPWER